MNNHKDENNSYEGNVFVIMPLAAKYKAIYTTVIKPAVEQRNYKCVRADEIANPGNINKDIVEYIARSDFVIADLTGANANVMYELGLSHTLGTVTIMISQKTENLPFDISNYRVIKYEKSLEGAEKLKKELIRYMSNIEKARREISNPVIDFLGGKGARIAADQLPNPLQCFKALCISMEAMKDQKEDDEDIKLLRALPTEMSERIFGRRSGASELYIRNYEKVIKEYIERPDLDDETIFGCPPDTVSLEETLSKIKTSYFPYPESDKSTKEVSAVAFHPYLSGYSLFLLGRMKNWEDNPAQYQIGFIFFLNRQGIPINGIRVTDVNAIRILFHLWTVILNEIEYLNGGVKLKKFKNYTLNANSHISLFREYIAEDMVSIFNKINETNLELRTAQDADTIELIS